MLAERYECKPTDIIVLIDEVDLPWGMLRIRDSGRNSTHNGLKSIIGALGTDEFIRIRLGVQPDKMRAERREYVLGPMGREERLAAQEMANEACTAVELVLAEGVDKAMSRFNRKVSPGDESLD
jgi:PTH1 family peptidyl-tRNA hydrolase